MRDSGNITVVGMFGINSDFGDSEVGNVVGIVGRKDVGDGEEGERICVKNAEEKKESKGKCICLKHLLNSNR